MPIQLLSSLSHSPHPSDHRPLLLALWDMWGAHRVDPPQPIPFPSSEVLREGKCSHEGMWIPTKCRELFLGSALQLQICSDVICLPGAVKECFQSPETSARRTSLPCPCSLHHSLGGSCTLFYLKPQYFPPALQDTQLPLVFTSKPLFKQTEVGAIYLAHKHTLLYTQQESKPQKCSANEEIQTMMLAAINRQNCPNRSELDPPLLHESSNQFLQLLKETRTKHKQSDYERNDWEQKITQLM